MFKSSSGQEGTRFMLRVFDPWWSLVTHQSNHERGARECWSQSDIDDHEYNHTNSELVSIGLNLYLVKLNDLPKNPRHLYPYLSHSNHCQPILPKAQGSGHTFLTKRLTPDRIKCVNT